MIKIVFVCLGNICRSPMAEAAFLRIAKERGVENSFLVISRATSDCEEGNPVYPPAAKTLRDKGYTFTHRAQKISLQDIINADYVLVMDEINMRDIKRFTCGNYADKILKLGGFLDPPADIADPWYTDDFERAYGDIYSACRAFMDYLFSVRSALFRYDKSH